MSRVRALLLAVILVACGAGQPSMEVWTAETWRPTLELIPPPHRADPQTCEVALGRLRERAPTVRPAPTVEVGDAADAWLRAAETLMFDCAADEDDFNYTAGYEHLRIFESEVEALIAQP